MEKRYFRAKEIATYLGVTITTVWNYVSRGLLTPIKISEHATVFDIQEVGTFIENAKDSFDNKVTLVISGLTDKELKKYSKVCSLGNKIRIKENEYFVQKVTSTGVVTLIQASNTSVTTTP